MCLLPTLLVRAARTGDNLAAAGCVSFSLIEVIEGRVPSKPSKNAYAVMRSPQIGAIVNNSRPGLKTLSIRLVMRP